MTRVLQLLRRPLALALFVGVIGSAAVAAAGGPSSYDQGRPEPSPTPPLAITTAVLSAAQAQSAYTATLTTAGGSGMTTWSLAAGSVAPPGLTLSPAGILAGTPTVVGTYDFTVEAKSTGPVFSGSPMPELHDIAPFGPSMNGFFQYVMQDLGLLPQPATGQGSEGRTVVKLNDAVTTLQLTVQPAVTITTTILQSAQIQTPYFVSLTAQGGSGDQAYIWSLPAGSSLPPGLSLSPTGLLQGTPTHVGLYTFTVQVADVATPGYTTSQTLSLKVLPPGLQVSTYLLANGTVGQSYTQQVTATGGTTPYAWSVVPGSGTLPAGLSLDKATGVIAGTPTVAGTNGFTVAVTDSGSTTAGAIPAQQTAEASLTITIAPGVGVTVNTSGVPSTATQGQPFSGTVTATGGTGPYSFSLSGEPDGLSINPSTGAITGTPSQAGDFNMAVTATDHNGVSATSVVLLTVAQASALSITTTSLPSATQGQPYVGAQNAAVTLAATGGTGPYTWSVTCSVNQTTGGGVGTCDSAAGLPQGLTLDSATGVISGTPAAAGSYSLDFTATDSTGASSSATLVLTVRGTALAITTTSPLPNAVVGECYTQAGTSCVSGHTNNPVQLQASGGVQPYSWNLIPCTTAQTSCFSTTGLTIQTNGDILGTPAGGTQGKYSVTVQVQDAQGASAQTTLQLTIEPPVSIQTTSLPEGAAGVSYNQTLQATGGATPYTWSLSCASGNTGNACLPSGLSLNTASGQISGTPTQGTGGTSSFTAQVTDHGGGTASQALSINVLGVSTGALPDATAGTAYSASLSAVGGSGSYTWSCSGLPSGLSCSTGGVIAGTTSSQGTFTISATVTDSNQVTSTRQISLTVS